jgi:hypothetical protein
MKTILFLLLIVTLSGCVTQKRCNRKFPPKTETIYIETVVEKIITKYRDTTIYVELPAKEIINTVYVPTPIDFKSDTVFAYGDYSSAKAWVARQKLQIKLNEGGKLKVDLNNAIRETTYWKEKYLTDKQTVTVEVNRLKNWQIVLMVIGLVAILLGIFKLVLTFKKF